MDAYMRYRGQKLAQEVREKVSNGDIPESMIEVAIWIETALKNNPSALAKAAQQQMDGMLNVPGSNLRVGL